MINVKKILGMTREQPAVQAAAPDAGNDDALSKAMATIREQQKMIKERDALIAKQSAILKAQSARLKTLEKKEAVKAEQTAKLSARAKAAAAKMEPAKPMKKESTTMSILRKLYAGAR